MDPMEPALRNNNNVLTFVLIKYLKTCSENVEIKYIFFTEFEENLYDNR